MIPDIYNQIGINAEGKIISVGNKDYEISSDSGQINYFSLTGTNITITAVSDGLATNFVLINPSVTLAIDNNFSTSGSADLTYGGIKTGLFHIDATFSYSAVTGSETLVFAFAVNGTVLNKSRILCKNKGAGEIASMSMTCMQQLTKNDYIQIYVANTTNDHDIIIHTLLITAHG